MQRVGNKGVKKREVLGSVYISTYSVNVQTKTSWMELYKSLIDAKIHFYKLLEYVPTSSIAACDGPT